MAREDSAAIQAAAQNYYDVKDTLKWDRDRQRLEERLLKVADAYIITIATEMANKSLTQDQKQDARIAALEALRSYDATKSQYRTWAYYYIRKTLYRNRYDLIRVPAKYQSIKVDTSCDELDDIQDDTDEYDKVILAHDVALAYDRLDAFDTEAAQVARLYFQKQISLDNIAKHHLHRSYAEIQFIFNTAKLFLKKELESYE